MESEGVTSAQEKRGEKVDNDSVGPFLYFSAGSNNVTMLQSKKKHGLKIWPTLRYNVAAWISPQKTRDHRDGRGRQEQLNAWDDVFQLQMELNSSLFMPAQHVAHQWFVFNFRAVLPCGDSII